MSKFIWIFGAISGILGSFAEYLVYSGAISFDDFGGVRIFKILALVICIVFANLAYKKVRGEISLGRVMLNSMLISIVRSVFLIAGFLWMYYPNGERFKTVIDYAHSKSIEMMEEKDRTSKNIATKKEEIIEQFSLEGYPKFAIMGSLLSAGFSAVFLGLIIASKPKTAS